MTENSPNKERIDTFEERILERFDYTKMKDWSLERLHEARWLIEIEFKQFKSSFPPKGGLEGPARGWAHDDRNEEKYAITSDEQMRLRHIKRTALGELNRAEGNREEKNREHRLKIYNTAVDFVRAVGELFKNYLPSW